MLLFHVQVPCMHLHEHFIISIDMLNILSVAHVMLILDLVENSLWACSGGLFQHLLQDVAIWFMHVG